MSAHAVDREAADRLLMLAAVQTVAELLAENASLAKRLDDALAIARINQESVIGLVARYDEERQCIPIEPDPGCLACTSGTTPNDRNTGPCAFHRAKGVAP
jgi:hypothetical protein